MAKPIDEIEFNELAPTLKALAKAGGTTEHADWMRSGGNAKRLIQLIDELRNMPSTEATYKLRVSYAKLPGIAALEKKFSKRGVSSLFDGRAWERHSPCTTIDETPGERILHLAEMPEKFLDRKIEDCLNELAAYFDKKGERFAIEVEAVEFAEAHPDLQRENYILALGSSALGADGDRYVAMLGADDRGRILGGHWVFDRLGAGGRLLLVSKPV